MTATAALAVRSWTVNAYTCTLTVQRPKPGAVVACSIEWSPNTPNRLSDAELQTYRRGRNEALASIAAELGISAAVVEV